MRQSQITNDLVDVCLRHVFFFALVTLSKGPNAELVMFFLFFSGADHYWSQRLVKKEIDGQA
jgi:hypothetical protein